MLMCSRCKKRPAVVFISQMNAKDPQHKKNEGLCLVCAKELGISQVDDYMKAMGISLKQCQISLWRLPTGTILSRAERTS